jgi:hypothetical protein
MSTTGCLFNLFQTARTIGAGNLAFTIGAVLLSVQVDNTTTMSVTPQARLAIGLGDAVDLGLQTGVMISFNGGDPGWLGLIGDLRFRLFDERDASALAMGFGGGHSIEYIGWGVLGEILFDSSVRILPIHFAYQPGIPPRATSTPSTTSQRGSSSGSRTRPESCCRWTIGPGSGVSEWRSRWDSRERISPGGLVGASRHG